MFRQFPSARATADFVAAFGDDAPGDLSRERVGRNCECHVVAVRMHDRHGWQQRTQSPGFAFVQFALDRRCIGRGATHRRQDRRLGFAADVQQFAAKVVVCVADTALPGELVEQ